MSSLKPLERVGLWSGVVTVFSGILIGMAALPADSIPSWVDRFATLVMVFAGLLGLAAFVAFVKALWDTFRETSLAKRVGLASTVQQREADGLLASFEAEIRGISDSAPSPDPERTIGLKKAHHDRVLRALERWTHRASELEDADQERRVIDGIESVRRAVEHPKAKNRYLELGNSLRNSR